MVIIRWKRHKAIWQALDWKLELGRIENLFSKGVKDFFLLAANGKVSLWDVRTPKCCKVGRSPF